MTIREPGGRGCEKVSPHRLPENSRHGADVVTRKRLEADERLGQAPLVRALEPLHALWRRRAGEKTGLCEALESGDSEEEMNWLGKTAPYRSRHCLRSLVCVLVGI